MSVASGGGPVGGSARACVLTARGQFEIREYPVPRTEPGTVLIEMELCGVCGTDLHYSEADLPPERYPVLLGHENVGRIAALGEGVDRDFLGFPVRVGDRVVATGGAPAGIPCGRCYFCAVIKTPERCVGGRPPASADHYPHLTGGYSQYLYLPVPWAPFFRTDMEPEVAMSLEPLTIAVHSMDRAGIRLGDTVVVQGVGAMGLFHIMGARMSGAVKIIAVGAPRARLDLAREFGADIIVDIAEVPDAADRVKQVRSETVGGYGADVVIECTGVPAAIAEGMACCRDSGRFVEVGHFVDRNQKVSLNPASELVRRNLTVVAPFASTVEHYARAIRVLARGQYPFQDLVSHRVPLHRLPDAIASLGGGYRLDGREVFKIAIAPNSP